MLIDQWGTMGHPEYLHLPLSLHHCMNLSIHHTTAELQGGCCCMEIHVYICA
jgi:hypothetical protein